MRKRIKDVALGIVVGLAMAGTISIGSTLVTENVYFNPFKILLNGKEHTTNLPILNYKDSTYVPLRELATLTGSEVGFEDSKIIINNTAVPKNQLPTSIIISQMQDLDYFASEGYGDDRRHITTYGGNYLPYEDIEDMNKYINKQYYVYMKNKYLGDVIVEPEEGPFDGEISLNQKYMQRDASQPLQVLIGLEYNAIPRKSENTTLNSTIKYNIQDILDYSNYEAEKIDLDGDNKYEYVIALKDNGNEKKSKIIIVNENGEKIADLVIIPNGHWFNDNDSNYITYIELSDLTYIDLDNDGKMEILVNLPAYEFGPDYTVFKYENENIIGNTVNVNLIP